jgi:type II secretory pathway pseudopilin PulG
VSPRRFLAPARTRPRATRVTLAPAAGRERGFSLIVAMLMLAVIGLASAAIMRNAVSGDQVANNNRLQTQASQYAQLALRFCQAQLGLPPEARVARLQPQSTPPAWTTQRNWSGTSNVAHTLTAAETGASVQPRVAPQCLAEASSLPNTYTVTARGFSADFKADPSTGATRTGSAVWVQATIYADSEASAAGEPPAAAGTVPAGPLSVRQRTWQQLLTPPF